VWARRLVKQEGVFTEARAAAAFRERCAWENAAEGSFVVAFLPTRHALPEQVYTTNGCASAATRIRSALTRRHRQRETQDARSAN